VEGLEFPRLQIVSLSRRTGNRWWSIALLAKTCLLKNLAISVSRLCFSENTPVLNQGGSLGISVSCPWVWGQGHANCTLRVYVLTIACLLSVCEGDDAVVAVILGVRSRRRCRTTTTTVYVRIIIICSLLYSLVIIIDGPVVSFAACGTRGREFDAALCSSCPMRRDDLSS